MNNPLEGYKPSPDERKLLQFLFQTVSELKQLDNTISDSKLVKDTKKQMKDILRDEIHKCSCNRYKYHMCEVCQATDSEVYYLRNFYRMICKAKENDWSSDQMKAFVENTKLSLIPKETKQTRPKKSERA